MVNTREVPGDVGQTSGAHPTDPSGGTEKGPGASGQATGAGPTNPRNDYGVPIKPVGAGAPKAPAGGAPAGGPSDGGHGMSGPRMGTF